jgi:hypothetical protein
MQHGLQSIPVIQKETSSILNLTVELGGNLDHGEVLCFFLNVLMLSHFCKDPTQLHIKLHGTMKNLDIEMLCSEIEKVELINVHDDTLRFMWASRHGCPRTSTRRRASESTLNTWTSEEQEPSGDDREEEELLPSDSRKARTGIAFVIAIIV